MKPAELSLSELRVRLAELTNARELSRWLAPLANDPRIGARQLAVSIRRRLKARSAERLRIARLFERRARLQREGALRVAGVDEVGVGPLAGPVVAAAVVLGQDIDLPGLNDSKRLSARTRERLARAIRSQAQAVGIGAASPAEIDRLNIYRAALLAMRRAVAALPERPDHLLVDARTLSGVDIAQTSLVHGDAIDGSIAAASIVAKVHRDAIMRRLDCVHPGYGFARHMGYPTAVHRLALRRLGPSPVHRRSFAPVAATLSP